MAAVVVSFLNGILCPESHIYTTEKKGNIQWRNEKKFFLKTNSKSEFTEITNTTPPKEKEKEKEKCSRQRY